MRSDIKQGWPHTWIRGAYLHYEQETPVGTSAIFFSDEITVKYA